MRLISSLWRLVAISNIFIDPLLSAPFRILVRQQKTQPLQVGLIWHSLGNTLPRSVRQVPRERQVSWLLAASEPLQPSQPHRASGFLFGFGGLLPVTVAGPRRNCTGFPFQLL